MPVKFTSKLNSTTHAYMYLLNITLGPQGDLQEARIN